MVRFQTGDLFIEEIQTNIERRREIPKQILKRGRSVFLCKQKSWSRAGRETLQERGGPVCIGLSDTLSEKTSGGPDSMSNSSANYYYHYYYHGGPP